MGIKSNLCLWILALTNGVFGVGTAEMEGSSLTLPTDVQEYNKIFWIFEPQNWIIASCRVNGTPPCEITLGTEEQINTFRDRLKIVSNGSLTIMNISDEQAGLYTLQNFNKWNTLHEKEFNVSVSPPKTVNENSYVGNNSITNQTKQDFQPYSDSGLNPWLKDVLVGVAAVVAVAVAVAVAAVFLYKKFYKKCKAGRNGKYYLHSIQIV
ncbi:uncharacterized protein LOC127499978 [Ctenopharyngodon idella]|uniref:uncharacterized protein LOC127499978 n=1 Tax=Ctenopharyngodon idella TaxID=7959 RepID=UPI00222E6880|nr:uncharacterized protein LOC127499978 [Ctenopharyngodon idella]